MREDSVYWSALRIVRLFSPLLILVRPMRRLRTKRGSRLLVALMVTSLTSWMVVPWVGVAEQAAVKSYADWLRTQWGTASDAAATQAFEVAKEAQAQSLHDFLSIFVAAYLAQAPQAVVIEAWASSHEALMLYLQGQFLRLVGDAVLPHATLVSAPMKAPHQTLRCLVSVLGLSSKNRCHQAWETGFLWGMEASQVLSVRDRWAAMPLGP